MARKNDTYFAESLGILADAATGVVADASGDDVGQVADDLLHVAVSAMDDLADLHPSRRAEIAVQIRMHVLELRELVQRWQEEAQEGRLRGPERP